MVPNITAEGTSFYGAFLYYFHDKQARTRERIGFTQTLNMLTDCVDKAWKVMAYTAKNAAQLKKASGQVATGAKLKKSVFAYSLAWHPEQTPTKEDMLQAAKESLAALGLSEHEAMIAEHLDEPQPHLHIVVNKVHPLTGLVAKLKYTKDKLSDFAHKLERKEGKMYCPQREENHRKREGGKMTKYIDSIVAEAWGISRSGGEFQKNLEDRGYQLAQGRKCIVVVDPQGKPSNAARVLGIKAKDFKGALGQDGVADLKSFEQATDDLQSVVARSKQKAQRESSSRDLSSEFEERKANALNQLALRQYDEVSALSSQHERSILSSRDELREFYRLEKKQVEIDKLAKKVGNPGFFQKLIGLHKHRVRRLGELKDGLFNAQMRFDEAIQTLDNKKASALEGLRTLHLEQRQELERSFRQWKPAAHQHQGLHIGKERGKFRGPEPYDRDLGR